MYLHRQGVAHRDLKPGNLMVKHIGENEILKISNFGTAKQFTKENLMKSFVAPLSTLRLR